MHMVRQWAVEEAISSLFLEFPASLHRRVREMRRKTNRVLSESRGRNEICERYRIAPQRRFECVCGSKTTEDRFLVDKDQEVTCKSNDEDRRLNGEGERQRETERDRERQREREA